MTNTPPNATSIPETLANGKYVVQRMLGQGAMGVVYEAIHPDLQRRVAIKLLHASVTTRPQAMERFRREALAASRIEHPNSTRVLDFGEDNGACYIVMEFLEGQSLGELVERSGPLTLDRAVWLLSQVLSALAVAHDKGIVHRDLKPDNVMVVSALDEHGTPQERAKVCDFGIAKLFGPESSETLTQDGSVSGTPHYMSPEQCQGQKLDARSDLYACGVILYRLLTGEVPFTGDNPFAIVFSQVTEAVPDVSAIRSDLGPRVDDFVRTAMAKTPDARFQSAREMRAVLRALTSEGSTEPRMQVVVTGAAAKSGETRGSDPETDPTAQFDSAEARAAFSSLAAQQSKVEAVPAAAERRSDMRAALPWLTAMVAIVTGGVIWASGAMGPTPAAAPPAGPATASAAAIPAAVPATGPATGGTAGASPTAAQVPPPAATGTIGTADTGTASPKAALVAPDAAVGGQDASPSQAAPPPLAAPAAQAPAAQAPAAQPAAASKPSRPAPTRRVAGKAPVARGRRPTRAQAVPKAPPVDPATTKPLAAKAVAPTPATAEPAPTDKPVDASPAGKPTPATPTPVLPAPKPVPAPKPAVVRPAFNPKPATGVSGIRIDGGISKRVITKALGSLPSSATNCWRNAAKAADIRSRTTVRIAFTIDEDGRFRGVKATGGSTTLAGCIATAVKRLRSRTRPDTGTVDVTANVVFTP